MAASKENTPICSCSEDVLRTRTKTGEREQQSCREAGVHLGKLLMLKVDSDREGMGSWDLGQRYTDAPRTIEPPLPINLWA